MPTDKLMPRAGHQSPPRRVSSVAHEWLYLVLLVATVSPVFAFRFLPFWDLPHWTFQTYLLQQMRLAPEFFNKYYRLSPVPAPNSGFPVLAWLLGLAVPSPSLVAKLCLALSIVGFLCGASFLIRSVQKERSALEFLPFIWAYGWYVHWGLLCFQLSLGLCLLSMGFLQRTTRGGQVLPPRQQLAMLAFLSVFTYVCHLMGWVALAIAIATYGGSICLRQRKGAGLPLLATLLPTVLLLAWYTIDRSGSVSVVRWPGLPFRILRLSAPLHMFFRLDPFDLQVPGPLVLNFAVLALALALLASTVDWRRGRGTWWLVNATLFSVGGICMAAAVALPFYFFAQSQTPGARLVQPALWAVVASLRYRSLRRWQSAVILALVALVLAVNVLSFRRAEPLLAEIFHATHDAIPADASVFAVALKNAPLWNACRDTTSSKPAVPDVAFGIATLRWFDNYRLMADGGYDARIIDTALIKYRDPERRPRSWVTERSREDLEGASLSILADARDYDVVELFGCPQDLRRVELLLTPEFFTAARGQHYSVLMRAAP